jgi:hypothetical protein
MGQVSPFLRRTATGYSHWCPPCGEMHNIPDSWTFDGNLNTPTFNPSVKITGKQTVQDDKGEWTGDWVRGPDGKALDLCCHYFLHAGVLKYCGDCTHSGKGQNIPLPPLPDFMTDTFRG